MVGGGAAASVALSRQLLATRYPRELARARLPSPRTPLVWVQFDRHPQKWRSRRGVSGRDDVYMAALRDSRAGGGSRVRLDLREERSGVFDGHPGADEQVDGERSQHEYERGIGDRGVGNDLLRLESTSKVRHE